MNAKASPRKPSKAAAAKAAAAAQAAEAAAASTKEFWSLKRTGLLHIAVIVLALFAATLIIFIWPNQALLAVVPALLGVLPLVLPIKWRVPAAIVNAVVVTGFVGLTTLASGVFFSPVAIMMCAAAIVPWRMKKGLQFAKMPVWRTVLAALIALPGILLTAGFINGTVTLTWPIVTLALVTFVLASLLGIGKRFATLGIAGLGLIVMVLSITNGGYLMFLMWWIGGLFVILGMTAYVAWGSESSHDPHPKRA